MTTVIQVRTMAIPASCQAAGVELKYSARIPTRGECVLRNICENVPAKMRYTDGIQ